MSIIKTSIALAGSNGRLGREIRQAIEADAGLDLAIGITRDQPLTEIKTVKPNFDVILDVSSCDGVVERLPVVLALNKPIVIGVTGFTTEQENKVLQASKFIPVLLSGNFSIGLNQLLAQVKQTAHGFGKSAQIEISETHHLAKKDYPSGTALMLAQAVMDGLGFEMTIKSSLWPQKLENITPDTLPIICYRKEAVIGEHKVIFTLNNEQVVLGHTALERSVFADGALQAARWIIGQNPGIYQMSHVLA